MSSSSDEEEDAHPAVPPTPEANRHRGEEDVLAPATPPHQQSNNEDPPETPLTPLFDEGATDENEAQQQQQQDGGTDDAENLPDAAQQGTIRGTQINVRDTADAFKDFLRNFISLAATRRAQEDHDDDLSVFSDDTPEQPLYVTKLQELGTVEGTASLEIDTMHLFYHSQDCQRLYHQLVKYPLELVPLMDIVVQQELERLFDDQQVLPSVQVRPFNLKKVSNLRELDPVSMDSLVSCKGMIVRSSPIIPDLKVAHFGCSVCGNAETSTIDRGRVSEPQHPCPNCNAKGSWNIVHNRCIFADKQMVRLQETPDEVPAGQTPASVVTFCFDDLVDSVSPGDRVEVTGVLRAQPVRVHPRVSKVKSVYKTYLDVIHFRTVNSMEDSSKKEDLTLVCGKFTEQRIEELKALSRDPDIYQKLTDSLAPSIWELENTKKGILCMLFGGNHVRVKKGSSEINDEEQADGDDAPSSAVNKLNKRGDINCLLVGDPGTSKSQLLSYVNKLSTRGVYTSGKGSSAVGLTASVVRDPETRELVLESGALVLSDQGICCIDEFDKMSDATRSVLHEAMEQQTVSVAKAGIIATLHARTSVLASANPIESRYNPNLSVVENIKLPPTLLSRFDLIYLILDSPNVETDRRLAQHLVGLYYETPNVVTPPLDQALLKDYIEYARENIHPEISDEASAQLIESYLEMRNPPGGSVAANGTRTISATTRQLESLIRLSEALAKIRYSSIVTRADVREAVRLMKVATQTAATDPRTGRIDMDMIATGRSRADRELEEQIEMNLKELFQERRGNRMAVRDVTRQLAEINNNNAPPHDDVVEALRRLHADGVIQFKEREQTIFVRSGIVR